MEFSLVLPMEFIIALRDPFFSSPQCPDHTIGNTGLTDTLFPADFFDQPVFQTIQYDSQFFLGSPFPHYSHDTLTPLPGGLH